MRNGANRDRRDYFGLWGGGGVLALEYKNQIMNSTKKKQKIKCWIRKWVAKRDELGASNMLLQELKNEDQMSYKNVLRMSDEHFNYLLNKVEKNKNFQR